MSIIINELIANDANYQKQRTKEINYIVIHYTANNGDTSKNNADYFKNNVVETSAHYFVDENEIYLSVKEADTAWHCGASIYYHKECRNNNSLGIELCSRKDSNGNYYFVNKTVSNAVELVKSLMQKYNVPVQNVIRHYDVTHKICPAPFVNNASQWNYFISLLEEKPAINTTSQAIERLVASGIITTPDYWYNAIKSTNYLSELLIASANKVQITKENNYSNAVNAIASMVELNIIKSPDYWIKAIGIIKYLDSLIINIANHM